MSVNIQTLQSLGLAQQPASTASTASGTQNVMGQDVFMKLLVAQLKNQNPLQPQNGTEFISQLAQFSTVSGIQSLQQSFSNFSSTMNQDQALTATNLVGKNVLIASSQGILGATGGISGQVTVPAGASNVSVQIVGANGVAVRTIDLGTPAAGQASFQWDGTLNSGTGSASPGLYTIQAQALVGGKTQALTTQVQTPVDSVTLGGTNGLEVDLGALGKHGLQDIQEIL